MPRLGTPEIMAMVDDILRDQPDNIMLPSFDELIGGPSSVPPEFRTAQYTVGFPPAEQTVQFLDTYGAERSRTWVPTVEASDFYLRLTQSCLRVIALGTRNCSVHGELCCDRTAAQFNHVYSLRHVNGTDFMPSLDPARDRQQLFGEWEEICASSLGPYSSDVFCFAPGETSFAPRQGPFLSYTLPHPPAAAASSLLHQAPRLPLFRCRATSGRGNHFISGDDRCGGAGVMESPLGFSSSRPHTGMPRRLRSCERADGVRYHTLDAFCLGEDKPTELGHVL